MNGGYTHKYFVRGKPSLCSFMKRKKVKGLYKRVSKQKQTDVVSDDRGKSEADLSCPLPARKGLATTFMREDSHDQHTSSERAFRFKSSLPTKRVVDNFSVRTILLPERPDSSMGSVSAITVPCLLDECYSRNESANHRRFLDEDDELFVNWASFPSANTSTTLVSLDDFHDEDVDFDFDFDSIFD